MTKHYVAGAWKNTLFFQTELTAYVQSGLDTSNLIGSRKLKHVFRPVQDFTSVHDLIPSPIQPYRLLVQRFAFAKQ